VLDAGDEVFVQFGGHGVLRGVRVMVLIALTPVPPSPGLSAKDRRK